MATMATEAKAAKEQKYNDIDAVMSMTYIDHMRLRPP
jgi:hypothetical protein